MKFIQYPSHLLKLQDSALATIDEVSHIKAHNRYYWIAGLDSSDSLIFGRVFYTVDVQALVLYIFHIGLIPLPIVPSSLLIKVVPYTMNQ